MRSGSGKGGARRPKWSRGQLLRGGTADRDRGASAPHRAGARRLKRGGQLLRRRAPDSGGTRGRPGRRRAPERHGLASRLGACPARRRSVSGNCPAEVGAAERQRTKRCRGELRPKVGATEYERAELQRRRRELRPQSAPPKRQPTELQRRRGELRPDVNANVGAPSSSMPLCRGSSRRRPRLPRCLPSATPSSRPATRLVASRCARSSGGRRGILLHHNIEIMLEVDGEQRVIAHVKWKDRELADREERRHGDLQNGRTATRSPTAPRWSDTRSAHRRGPQTQAQGTPVRRRLDDDVWL